MALSDAFSADPGKAAAAAQSAAIQQGLQGLNKKFGQGRTELTSDYAKGLQPYTQEFADYSKGTDALADAMGLNGPEGNARAAQAYANDPGHAYRLQQGTDAVLANAGRAGTMASGNTLIDLTKFGQQLGTQDWGNYVDRLNPYLGARAGAAQGIGSLYSNLGNQMNQSYDTQGNAIYGANASIGRAEAGGAMAGYDASKNLWGAGLALAGDVAQAMGGGKGGGGGSDLFGTFNKIIGGAQG